MTFYFPYFRGMVDRVCVVVDPTSSLFCLRGRGGGGEGGSVAQQMVTTQQAIFLFGLFSLLSYIHIKFIYVNVRMRG